jgi:hypothetical protein
VLHSSLLDPQPRDSRERTGLLAALVCPRVGLIGGVEVPSRQTLSGL